ncbi:MAG: YceH family protein [Deltaproteobacteria bacterium]|nr:YceH family protein [Deltaproteobacteria bacterium]
MRLPRPLTATEIRVLGALLEKAQTTPEYYPLTLNALRSACNQKSNRDPVMSLSETEIWDALERLRKDVLAWRSDGARSERWNESVTRRLGLQAPARAILTVLLLRGPQTPGELRIRTDRMHSFSSLQEVEESLQGLAEGAEPVVTELGRRPGQKETRWAHLIGGPIDEEAQEIEPESPPPTPTTNDSESRLEKLEKQVAWLTETVRKLQEDLGSEPGSD